MPAQWVTPCLQWAAGEKMCHLPRRPEVDNGVPVQAPDGSTLGLSKAAAIESIKFTVLSRNCALPIIPMLAPPVIMAGLRRVPLIAAGGAVAAAAEVLSVSACLGLGLPLAIAIFPQEMQIATSKLEPEFQGLKDSNGKPIDFVRCNKGL